MKRKHFGRRPLKRIPNQTQLDFCDTASNLAKRLNVPRTTLLSAVGFGFIDSYKTPGGLLLVDIETALTWARTRKVRAKRYQAEGVRLREQRERDRELKRRRESQRSRYDESGLIEVSI